jgi:hypothetical protein
MGHVEEIKVRGRVINIDMINININMIDLENTWCGV